MFDQRSLFTSEVLDLLRRSNPNAHVTEGRLRSAIRSGRVPTPRVVSGCYLWTGAEIRTLAAVMALEVRASGSSMSEDAQ